MLVLLFLKKFYFRLCWVFVAVRELSLVVVCGASHCGGLSYCGAQVEHTGFSSCSLRTLEGTDLSSCDEQV